MLERKKTRIATERSARKEPLSDQEVKALLSRANTVVVAKGKKQTSMPSAKVKLADLKGPTGNYRAPMVLTGKTLIVGFSPESLDRAL